MTPSNATNAIAFAGNARRKHGTKPRQYLSAVNYQHVCVDCNFFGDNLPSPSRVAIHRFRCVLNMRIFPIAAEPIGHNALLHDV